MLTIRYTGKKTNWPAEAEAAGMDGNVEGTRSAAADAPACGPGMLLHKGSGIVSENVPRETCAAAGEGSTRPGAAIRRPRADACPSDVCKSRSHWPDVPRETFESARSARPFPSGEEARTAPRSQLPQQPGQRPRQQPTLYGEAFIDCERQPNDLCAGECPHYGACIADYNIRELGEEVYRLQIRIDRLERLLAGRRNHA